MLRVLRPKNFNTPFFMSFLTSRNEKLRIYLNILDKLFILILSFRL